MIRYQDMNAPARMTTASRLADGRHDRRFTGRSPAL